MGGGERGQQHLAEQEHAEEPQRLPEPVAGDADQLVRDAIHQQGEEGDADHADRAHGRQEEPVDAARYERRGRATALPCPQVRGVPGESADDEEQRHHLQDPAQRSDPPRTLARIHEQRTGIGYRDPDHQSVQDDDAEHAEGADQVDAGVAAGPVIG